MGGECSRAVPPAVRNERNPHYRAPNNSALYDDGCVAACFSPPSTPTQARECWPSGWCSSAAGRVAPLASLRVDRPSSENNAGRIPPTHTHRPSERAQSQRLPMLPHAGLCRVSVRDSAGRALSQFCAFISFRHGSGTANGYHRLSEVQPPSHCPSNSRYECAGASTPSAGCPPSSATRAVSTGTCRGTAPCKAAAGAAVAGAAAAAAAAAATPAAASVTSRGNARRRRTPRGVEGAAGRAAAEATTAAAVAGITAAAAGAAALAGPPSGRTKDDDEPCYRASKCWHLVIRASSASGFGGLYLEHCCDAVCSHHCLMMQ